METPKENIVYPPVNEFPNFLEVWMYNKTGTEYLRHKDNGSLYDRNDQNKMLGIYIKDNIFILNNYKTRYKWFPIKCPNLILLDYYNSTLNNYDNLLVDPITNDIYSESYQIVFSEQHNENVQEILVQWIGKLVKNNDHEDSDHSESKNDKEQILMVKDFVIY